MTIYLTVYTVLLSLLQTICPKLCWWRSCLHMTHLKHSIWEIWTKVEGDHILHKLQQWVTRRQVWNRKLNRMQTQQQTHWTHSSVGCFYWKIQRIMEKVEKKKRDRKDSHVCRVRMGGREREWWEMGEEAAERLKLKQREGPLQKQIPWRKQFPCGDGAEERLSHRRRRGWRSSNSHKMMSQEPMAEKKIKWEVRRWLFTWSYSRAPG